MPNVYTQNDAYFKICVASISTNAGRNCLGGDCMAWVDEVVMEADPKDIVPKTGVESVRPVKRIPVKTGKGYCGLVR